MMRDQCRMRSHVEKNPFHSQQPGQSTCEEGREHTDHMLMQTKTLLTLYAGFKGIG